MKKTQTLKLKRRIVVCFSNWQLGEGLTMSPITKITKRDINMPLKKALPLLFVCIILLATVSIAGCPGRTSTVTPTETITKGAYRGAGINLKTTVHADGTRTDDGSTGIGGTWLKEFDANGRLKSIKWETGTGQQGGGTYNPSIDDPHPGTLQGRELINLQYPQQGAVQPTPTAEVLPITPFDSDHVDIAVATPVPHSDDHADTPEHIEGWV